MGTKRTLYFATNRRHRGDRWTPSGYGRDVSRDGQQNLRFGHVTVEVDNAPITKAFGDDGLVNGEALASYFARRVAQHATIEAYEEKIDPALPEDLQASPPILGSNRFFAKLHGEMLAAQRDVLVFVHGYNVSWKDAVGSALALQESLDGPGSGRANTSPRVVLFTWPSDGQMLPYTSYRSDRTDARGSGAAFGRALLKFRDLLRRTVPNAHDGLEPCGRDVHLLCHSMGNYVLQAALRHMDDYVGPKPPKLFDQVLLCAADVDDDVLEPSCGLGALPSLCAGVSIYHNRRDAALTVSDATKGNAERLGHHGASRPHQLHRKISQVDCTAVAGEPIGHSYYLSGATNADIRQTLAGLPQDGRPARRPDPTLPRSWALANGHSG